VLTGNGFQSQGIQGGKGSLIYNFAKDLKLTFNSEYQTVLDLDFINSTPNAPAENITIEDGKTIQAGAMGEWHVSKRNMGLEYYAGAESRYVRDNIRNDVMVTRPSDNIEEMSVTYYFKTDELQYRNSWINNLVGRVSFENVPNLSVSAKVLAGFRQNFSLPDTFLVWRTWYDQISHASAYFPTWEEYRDKNLFSWSFLAKFQYLLDFELKQEGFLSVLNILNRVQIVPQFKVEIQKSWARLEGETMADPLLEINAANPTTEEISRWLVYRRENVSGLHTAPILLVNLKVAEHTTLQYGNQWLTNQDFIYGQENNRRHVQVLQLINQDNVAGYNISLMLGLRLLNQQFPYLTERNIFNLGSPYNINNYEYFVRVYAGN
jgi:hypothetical protein